MANDELLDQVMTHIKDHPEQHYQDIWMNDCGTAACFAGWTCLLNGLTQYKCYTLNSTPRLKAIELLEIDEDDSVVLFSSLNSREELELMVKDLHNGESLLNRWKFNEMTCRWERKEEVEDGESGETE